jgi:hypothetical protein
VSDGREQTARAVMFVRMSRSRLSRAICDARPFTMPTRDFAVSQSVTRALAQLWRHAARGMPSFSQT